MHTHACLRILALVALAPCLLGAADFPETVPVNGIELRKVGEGTFRWTFFKVYDGALYLEEGKTDADPLSDVGKRLVLEYARSLTAEQFQRSGDAIVERNTDAVTWERLQDRLARLNAAYRDVGEGDQYALTYIPGAGTTLSLNDQPLVQVEGADFARAYFSIWLGKDPAKESFRDDLLGK